VVAAAVVVVVPKTPECQKQGYLLVEPDPSPQELPEHHENGVDLIALLVTAANCTLAAPESRDHLVQEHVVNTQPTRT
jgi:hypothetical protein